jgi:hypothetical protein
VEEPQTLYDQSATQFSMPLYLRRETEVEPQLIADLADYFLSNLLFPGTRLTSLWTKRPGDNQRLNIGDFTSSRWKAAQKKILNGQYAVVRIAGETPDFPRQKIAFSVDVNPVGRTECPISGEIRLTCSVSYLRHVSASQEKVEALVELGRRAWNGIDGGPAYGYGHLAIILARPIFDPDRPPPAGSPFPLDPINPPEHRTHPVPIAYVGNDIEVNLSSLYCGNRGIKGAFWANFLSADYVERLGGEGTLKRELNGMRIERLEHGGVLIIATDTPLPDDTEGTRSNFLRLDEALRPAFLSREATSANKRRLLGYFYRERPPLR